jgi:hypothetical protein
MTTRNQYEYPRGCHILRDVRREEILNEKVLVAVQMKAGRDTREQEIVGVIYEQLGVRM